MKKFLIALFLLVFFILPKSFSQSYQKSNWQKWSENLEKPYPRRVVTIAANDIDSCGLIVTRTAAGTYFLRTRVYDEKIVPAKKIITITLNTGEEFKALNHDMFCKKRNRPRDMTYKECEIFSHAIENCLSKGMSNETAFMYAAYIYALMSKD